MENQPHLGHDIEDPKNPRTADVITTDGYDFAAMLLPPIILNAMHAARFKRPSPIQAKALPLARCGFDLLVIAKAGTGKTLVFGVAALEIVKTETPTLQVMIIAPTREIAVQIKDVIALLGKDIKGLKVRAFIGGIDQKNDKIEARGCHIAVVTPGRARQLVENKILQVDNLRLFVLDEADKLMESCFISDINKIMVKTSASKQIILACATLCEGVNDFVKKHMNEPFRVGAAGAQLFDMPSYPKVLYGVTQYAAEVDFSPNVAQQLRIKAQKLIAILKSIPFNQCVVFSNYQSRAESICNMVALEGWPVVSICGKQEQSERLAAVAAMKEYRCRILLSTDLTARGIDFHGVNLVVNLDFPYNTATYLHRIGRAGRFGSRGTAIVLLAGVKEVKKFRHILFEIGGNSYAVNVLPDDPAKYNSQDLEVMTAFPINGYEAEVEDAEKTLEPGTNSPQTLPGESLEKGNVEESSSANLDDLCDALIETQLRPKSVKIRSYEEIESVRKMWAENKISPKPAILEMKNEKLVKHTSAFLSQMKHVDIPSDVDESVLKIVVNKNWTDESVASSGEEASSESEDSTAECVPSCEDTPKQPSDSRPKTVTVNLPDSDYIPSESRPKSVTVNLPDSDYIPSESRPKSVTVNLPDSDYIPSESRQKTVTVNLPDSDYMSSDTNRPRSRKQVASSSGRRNVRYTEGGQGNPPQYYNDHLWYSDANAQWYSNWAKQLDHIRFYVEYMEYWRSTNASLYFNYDHHS